MKKEIKNGEAPKTRAELKAEGKKNEEAAKRPIYCDLFSLVWEHPIISAAIVCFFAIVFTSVGHISQITLALPFLGLLGLGVCAAHYISHKDIKNNQKVVFVLLSVIFALISLCFVMGYSVYPLPPAFLLNFGLAVVAGVYIYLGITNRLSTRNVILLLVAAAFLIRIAYITYLSPNLHQHDFGTIGNGEGHIGYIEYLYYNRHLPDFDVRTVYQFYHAPFHHILAALWLFIQSLMGIDYTTSVDNIQLLTTFYSVVSILLCYRLFRLLGLYGKGLIIASAVIFFSPALILMGADANNDMLSVCFMLGAIVNTIKWYRNRTFKYMICIALCVGLGMFTKLSVWMVAPAIAFVFVVAFFGDLKSFKKYLLQYIVFIAICAPIGLFWPIRNLVGYGVPMSYVPKLSEDSFQYIGNIPVTQRLFDFSLGQFYDVGDQFSTRGLYNEYNPLVAMFKTSVFDEGIITKRYPGIAGFNIILFWSAVAIGLVGFGAMVYFLIKKTKELSFTAKGLVFLLYAVVFISYYVFCFDFPHVCTENARYAIPLIVIGAYFLGLAVQYLNKKDRIEHAAANVISTLCIIYCSSSALVFDIVCHKTYSFTGE